MRQEVLDIVERHVGRGRPSGDGNMSLRCPFHKGGQETRPSFSVSLDLGIYNCYTCHRSGTIPKLLRELGLSEEQVKLETAGIQAALADNLAARKAKQEALYKTGDPFEAPVTLSEAVLVPYRNNCPTKLLQAGFDPTLLQQLGIGFDLAKERIIYPIRDVYGHLGGVSGGCAYDWQQPKYKVYQGGYRHPETKDWIPSDFGEWFDERYPDYQFHNRNFLWNYERVYPHLFYAKEVQNLIVVEGFKACLWLLQHGYWNTVAIMGSRMSDRQRELLKRLQTRIILFLDNDAAGRDGTYVEGIKLQHAFGVVVARYPSVEACQPDNLSAAQLATAISGSIPYPAFNPKGVTT